MNPMIDVRGAHTAIVTPFRAGEVDYAALQNLVESQVRWRIDGIVVVGTTGESPTLSPSEHLEVIRRTVEFVKGRCLVIWGTGSNSTSEAIRYVREAEEVGVDGALIVAPYYNKPTQEGLYRHFRAIAERTELPIVLYSIPGRCGVEIGVETALRLARDCPNVIAIKEAGGRVERVSELRSRLDQAGLSDFEILSGDDALTVPFMSEWASGVISVASNLIPEEVGDLVRHMNAGDLREAQKIARRYRQLFLDLFLETNPVPVKTALASMRPETFSADVRLPLCEMSDTNRERLFRTMREADLG